ncbi:thiamine pyrophosphate-binding protein [Pseudoalteromonas xiamenensis]|uniref:thiamine pyrophosphate-binding protein n=1 Tax=Pseudoalteromonas xiamenensis TaxID=882626 RepID=UPI0035F01614
MKLSDYVAKKVVELGIQQVFMITGGGAMHLNQSFGRRAELNVFFNHHEQASTIAAEAYARLTGNPALVNVTTGPGGTNTITGIHGAWTDSIPMVVISGQVKTATIASLNHPELRQLGDQEIDICSVVRTITKYAVLITDPNSIRYHIEKAFFLATTGRPGPVWLDIPIDVQSCEVDEANLVGFSSVESADPTLSSLQCSQIISALADAKRPLVLLGTGVRTSKQANNVKDLVELWNIPVVTAWNAHDLIRSNHPLFVGKPGTVGDRSGNFAVQNADLVIVLGCRLNIRQISYNWQSFAKKAKLLMVDIDEQELCKPTLNVKIPICADLSVLVPELLKFQFNLNNLSSDWLGWCKENQSRFPVVLESYKATVEVNPYYFIERLFTALDHNQVVVAANGSACVIGFQAAEIKDGTRFWTNSGSASMGYDLPAAIGACLGNDKSRTICLAGDGSIMMNLQELETIRGNNLPIKVFIINNNGYSSIYQTHNNFFNGHEVGASPKSGVSLPNFEALSTGFGIKYLKIQFTSELDSVIDRTLNSEGPVICEVMVDCKQGFAPKLASKQLEDGTMMSPELDDMAPFLDREELDLIRSINE